MSVLHHKITDFKAIHQAFFITATDPATVPANDVQPYANWIDTTTGTSLADGWIWKQRNAGNTAWTTVVDLAAALAAGGIAASLIDALGDLIYGSADNTPARLAGNTTVTPKILQQTGNGTTSAAPTWVAHPEVLVIPISDEATAITTGTAKVTFRMPFAMHLTDVRASLTAASSSGTPTFDINEGGASILSTKLTVDASETTSTTAATPAVISDPDLADAAEITIDVDVAGTGAKGAKIYLIGTRA